MSDSAVRCRAGTRDEAEEVMFTLHLHSSSSFAVEVGSDQAKGSAGCQPHPSHDTRTSTVAHAKFDQSYVSLPRKSLTPNST